MEHGPSNPENRSPKKSWEFFEKPKAEVESTPEKKRWFKDDEYIKDKKENKDKSKDSDVKVNAKTGKKPSRTDEESNPDTSSKEGRSSKNTGLSPAEFATLPREEQIHILAKRYVKNRSDQLKVELETTDPRSLEAQEISADLALIENLDEKLDNPDLEVDDAVELAYQQIVSELTDILEATEEDPEEVEENLDEVYDPPETSEDSQPAPTPFGAFPRKAKKSPRQKTSGTTTPLVSSQAANHPSVGGQDSSGITSNAEVVSQNPQHTERVVAPQTSESRSSPESTQTVRRRRAGNLAVSEALTQMLAKRYDETPEITAQDVASDQGNPERVVNPVSRSINDRERKVRKLASSQVFRSPLEATPITSSSEVAASPLYEQPSTSAPEQVYVSTRSTPERQPEAPRQPLAKETSRNLEQVSTGELLKIAESIRVDGSTLRNLYDQNKIDRSGLTKVIKEALRGGDIKSAISKASLGEEAQRGRKIEMRHDDPALSGVHISTDDPENIVAQARTNQILEALHAVKQSKQQSQNTVEHSPATITSKSSENPHMAAARRTKNITISVAVALSVVGAMIALFFFL